MDVTRVPGRKGFPEEASSKWIQRKMVRAARAEGSGGRERPELVTDRDSDTPYRLSPTERLAQNTGHWWTITTHSG